MSLKSPISPQLCPFPPPPRQPQELAGQASLRMGVLGSSPGQALSPHAAAATSQPAQESFQLLSRGRTGPGWRRGLDQQDSWDMCFNCRLQTEGVSLCPAGNWTEQEKVKQSWLFKCSLTLLQEHSWWNLPSRLFPSLWPDLQVFVWQMLVWRLYLWTDCVYSGIWWLPIVLFK